jgi:hypothetical protein
LGIIGLTSVKGENVAPVNIIFELLLFLSIAFTGFKLQKSSFVITSTLLVYIVGSFVLAVAIRSSNILDFLVIYKSLIYFFLLTFFVGKQLFDQKSITQLFWIVTTLMSIKYLYTSGLSISERPALYRENNFELMFLALIFYLKFLTTNRVGWSEQLLLLGIFVLSGSRSGIIIFLVTLIGVHFERLTAKKLITGVAVAFSSGLVALNVLMSRMSEQGFEGIDRLNFLNKFFDEVHYWGPIDWAIGSDRITPLSQATCTSLNYYSELFSYSNDGSCYSVIFHSFILRAIFDHGLIGVFFMIGFIYWIMNISNYKKKDAVIVIVIALFNGLSVSSINSYFFALALIPYISRTRLHSTQNNTLKIPALSSNKVSAIVKVDRR